MRVLFRMNGKFIEIQKQESTEVSMVTQHDLCIFVKRVRPRFHIDSSYYIVTAVGSLIVKMLP